MTVVDKQLPQEIAADWFVRQLLLAAEKNETKLQQAAVAVDVDLRGISSLARRDYTLEKAFRIVRALDEQATFAGILSGEITRVFGVSTELLVHRISLDKLWELRLEDLDVRTRAYDRLKRMNLHMVTDILASPRSELAQFPGLGKKTLQEIESALEDYGLELGTPLGSVE